MGNMMGMGGVWMLVLLTGLVVLVVWIVKGLFPQGNSKDTALDIARERLARGEISHEEFEHMRRDLAASGRDSHA